MATTSEGYSSITVEIDITQRGTNLYYSPITHAGHCLSHISVTGEPTVTENESTIHVTLQLRETTVVGGLLYRLAWVEKLVAPSIPESGFASYFLVDDSVSGELRVILKRSLVGLPDYPVLKVQSGNL